MNTWANTVLTEDGRALMAKLTQGNTLDITRAVTGSGFVTPGLLVKQTAVTDPKQDLSFRPTEYPEAGKCAVTASLKNDGLSTGYTATQVGIYATDPDGGEILLFISQATDASSGTIIPSEAEMPGYSAEWTFTFQYGQADSVTVTVDPSNAVTWAQLEKELNAASAYKKAVAHGYSGTEEEFYTSLAKTTSEPEYVEYILESAKWKNSGSYTLYDIEGYDGKTVEVMENITVMTASQLEALENAKIKSYPPSDMNRLFAFGEVPTIDIPVLLIVR